MTAVKRMDKVDDVGCDADLYFFDPRSGTS